VRLHRSYFDAAGQPNPEAVTQTQEVVEACKAEGIYTHLSIYFPLWFRPPADTPWLTGYDGKTVPFAALFFNPDFQRQYQGWWRALLTTPHPTTKRKLVDEPALFGAELINEDSFFFWTFNTKALPGPQLRLLESQFGEWVKRRYGTLEAALTKWNNLQDPRDNFLEGRVGFRPLWNMFNERTPRDQDTTRFLTERQRAFYEDTQRFLRGLGYKGLITCSNWATASPQHFGPLEKYTYTVGDFIDRHGYFGCALTGPNAEWSVQNGHTWFERSALRFDAEAPDKPKQFVHPVMDPSYDGKPSMISETTFCRPNRYRSEAPLLYAAYGALQDSDALVHFALDSSHWTVKPNFFMQPWTLLSPAMLGQFPAAALLYRQGLVAPGDLMVNLNLKLDDLLALKGTPLPQDAAFDELRLKDVPSSLVLKPGNVLDPLVHFVGRTNVSFSKDGGWPQLRDLRGFVDRKAQTVTSSTKELKLDYGKGVLTINAPAAQGVSGDLSAAGQAELGEVSIKSDLKLGHVIAVSLDGEPLSKSNSILLQVATEEQPTDFSAVAAGGGLQRIANIGRDPWLVREAQGVVKFKRGDAKDIKVTALDENRYPAGDAGRANEIKLRPGTLYYHLSK
jgi:hypothetical protein